MHTLKSFGAGMLLLAGTVLAWPGAARAAGAAAKAKNARTTFTEPFNPKPVPHDAMQKIFDAVQTPYKYGVLIPQEPMCPVDCPNVYRSGDHWYMVYVCMNHVGYETHMAESDDLLHWKLLGTIIPFRRTGWDAWQVDASVALCSYQWGEAPHLEAYDGKYWLTYIGGAKQGYETDPLATGLAYNIDPTTTTGWTRYEGNPVLRPSDAGARPFETKTIYKTSIIWDHAKTLGWPFVMYYNGKQLVKKKSTERIGMAVSDNMVKWYRYGPGPVVDNHRGISGDPQIVKMGDLYVMFYFGAGWGTRGAFDTFAASPDLVHWIKWDGAPLIKPSEPYDKTFAHKPWLIKYNGVVYHFYCAVGKQGRVIALATSKDMKK